MQRAGNLIVFAMAYSVNMNFVTATFDLTGGIIPAFIQLSEVDEWCILCLPSRESKLSLLS